MESTRSDETLSAEDVAFTSNLHAALLLRGVDPRSRLILWLAAAFVLIFLLWAGLAPIDEVTRGAGKVIPSRHIQVIQNLEGGILSELLVEEGDFVEKGQILARMDNVRFSSDFQESRIKYLELLARTARLDAEVNERPFQVPEEVAAQLPAQGQNEMSLYQTRQNELRSSLSVLAEQVRQKEQQLTEFNSKKEQTARSYGLIMQEVAKFRPLVKEGAVSEVEVLRLERQANELKGDLDGYTLAIPRIRSELDEVKRKIEELKVKFKTEAAGKLNENKAELARTVQSNLALEDRVNRTQVMSPVKGTVNQIKISTIGGVIQPGMDLMEIVPIEDQLLIEARVRPKDVAFLRPGLHAMVKFTAYDFSIYGGLDAKLEHISADTIISEEGEEKGERFYLIRVRTDKNHLGPEDKPLEIIPGMTADVDIITGKKTVLQYLLKPVLKAKERALRER
jgi:adhesin transport system membrane fusion protein